MVRFLGKALLFALLQATIYYACFSASETRKRIPAMPPQADADRLTPLVREKLLPLWKNNRSVITDAIAQPPRNRLVTTLADQYIAGPDHYLKAAFDKYTRLQKAPGERLILVGGSNLAFGIDSELLEERYGIRTVNLGLTAELGVRFMLRQVTENVRKGDVVVLAIEYRTLGEDPDCTEERRETFCRHCPELAFLFEPDPNAPPDRRLRARFQEVKRFADRLALSEFSSHSETIAGRLLQSVWDTSEDFSKISGETVGTPEPTGKAVQSFDNLGRVPDIAPAAPASPVRELDRQIPLLVAAIRNEVDRRNQVYIRSRFNSQGDVTAHWDCYEPLSAWRGNIQDEAARQLVQLDDEYLRANLVLINTAADRCRAAGATVIFAHAPLLRTDEAEKFAARYEVILEETLRIPVLTTIAACFVQIDDLYDSCYHLNGQGISRRMKIWTTALDEILTPQVSLSPAEHIAARRRVRSGNAIVAENRTVSPTVH